MNLLQHIQTFFRDDVLPTLRTFLSTVAHAEVVALAPIAERVVAALAADLAANAGNLTVFGRIAGSALASTAAEAEAAGVAAAGGALLAAVGAALAPHLADASPAPGALTSDTIANQ